MKIDWAFKKKKKMIINIRYDHLCSVCLKGLFMVNNPYSQRANAYMHVKVLAFLLDL